MKRVAVIGNSHVAALKMGWERISNDYSERISMRFFAAKQPLLEFLAFDKERFGAIDPGKYKKDQLAELEMTNRGLTINLADFDEVLFPGLKYPEAEIFEILREFDVDDLPANNKARRLSLPAFQAFIDECIRATHVDANWFAPRQARVTFMRRPRPRKSIMRPDTPPENPNNSFSDISDVSLWAANDLLDERLHAFFRNAGVNFAPQPKETLTTACFTRDELARGSVRLTTGKQHPDNELFHMNAEYGRICMHAYLRRVLSPIPEKTE